MGFLYRTAYVRPPFAVEDRHLCCGYPPSFARSQNLGYGILGQMTGGTPGGCSARFTLKIVRYNKVMREKRQLISLKSVDMMSKNSYNDNRIRKLVWVRWHPKNLTFMPVRELVSWGATEKLHRKAICWRMASWQTTEKSAIIQQEKVVQKGSLFC